MNFICSEIIRENLQSFSQRFPLLREMAGLNRNSDRENIDFMKNYLGTWDKIEVTEARNGSLTALYRGKALHSLYNPEKESEKSIRALFKSCNNPDTVVFPGLGCGYGPFACSEFYPGTNIVVVEPEPGFLYLIMLFMDCRKFFAVKNLSIVLGQEISVVPEILNALKSNNVVLYDQPAVRETAPDFFEDLSALVKRTASKNKINSNTLKKFGNLWKRNMFRNLPFLSSLPPIDVWKDFAGGKYPVLLAGAGPSLDDVLDYIPLLAKSHIIVCVDTALRALLAKGVEPDFLVTVDPQYWNSRHIRGLKSCGTNVITESGVYPSVFQFQGKDFFLFSSLFPFGQYLEERTEKRHALGAGGSVATTAWDFSRYLNPSSIHIAGLDLSYPGGKTHFKGSLFESMELSSAYRLENSETASSSVYFSGGRIFGEDYSGRKLATDSRMKLYSWWFESRLAGGNSVDSFVIGKTGLKIPGMKTKELFEIMNFPEIRKETDILFSRKSGEIRQWRQRVPQIREQYRKALNSMQKDLESLVFTGERGLALIGQYKKSGDKEFLDKIGEEIRLIGKNPAKEIVSMTFVPEEVQGEENILSQWKDVFQSVTEEAKKYIFEIKNSSFRDQCR